MDAKVAIGLSLSLLAGFSASSQLDHALPPSEQAAAGQELAAKWRDAAPPENAEYHGALKLRHNEGQTETIPLTLKISAGEARWSVSYQAAPTPKTPGQILTIIHTPGQPNGYLFASGAKPGEPAGPPVPLPEGKRDVPFAGSDFSLTDLGLEFFHWPTQLLLRTEMRKGQVAKVLASVNPRPEGYARVVTWLDKESGVPILAEAYDRKGKLVKEFSIKSVKKVRGRYQLQEMQIRNTQTNSRTRIEYDLEKE
jgi:hypothetical protein